MPARKPPRLLSKTDEELPFKVAFKIGGVVFATERFATLEEANAYAASFGAEKPLDEGSSLTEFSAVKAKRSSRK